jgi:hypothetical protein
MSQCNGNHSLIETGSRIDILTFRYQKSDIQGRLCILVKILDQFLKLVGCCSLLQKVQLWNFLPGSARSIIPGIRAIVMDLTIHSVRSTSSSGQARSNCKFYGGKIDYQPLYWKGDCQHTRRLRNGLWFKRDGKYYHMVIPKLCSGLWAMASARCMLLQLLGALTSLIGSASLSTTPEC